MPKFTPRIVKYEVADDGSFRSSASEITGASNVNIGADVPTKAATDSLAILRNESIVISMVGLRHWTVVPDDHDVVKQLEPE